MQLPLLSAEAVALIIGDEPFQVDRVLSLTDGNPLFVAEVVASDTRGIPLSIQDTVLARAARLSDHARALLDVI